MENDVALSPSPTQSEAEAEAEAEADLSLLPKHLLDKVLTSSKSQTLKQSLETLIESSRTPEGRHTQSLSTTDIHILSPFLHLTKTLSPHTPHQRHILSLSLKLLRNLCAGESENQRAFLALEGVETVSSLILLSLNEDGDCDDCSIARFGLQVLANVCLAGEEQQRGVWRRLFFDGFVEIAKVRRRETCDPLCMILYTCCDGIGGEVVDELCGDCGLVVLCEIVRTAALGNSGSRFWFDNFVLLCQFDYLLVDCVGM